MTRATLHDLLFRLLILGAEMEVVVEMEEVKEVVVAVVLVVVGVKV